MKSDSKESASKCEQVAWLIYFAYLKNFYICARIWYKKAELAYV